MGLGRVAGVLGERGGLLLRRLAGRQTAIHGWGSRRGVARRDGGG